MPQCATGRGCPSEAAAAINVDVDQIADLKQDEIKLLDKKTSAAEGNDIESDGGFTAVGVPALESLEASVIASSLTGNSRGSVQMTSIPGAYAMPGLPDQNETEERGVPSVCAEASSRRHDNSHALPTNHEGLAVAHPALDEELIRAEPLAPMGSTAVSKWDFHPTKQTKCLACFWFLGIGLVGAILGTLLPDDSVDDRTIVPPVDLPVPSNAPSPSPVPSFAPTSLLNSLLDRLPDHTLESLVDPFSPQFQAWDWLSHHRNLSSLPEWRKTQLFSLAVFYYSFQGPHWPVGISRNWLDDTVHECDWFSSLFGYFAQDGGFQEGIANPNNTTGMDLSTGLCDPANGEVVDISLIHLNLTGWWPPPIIPREVAFLTSLSTLFVGWNRISGTLDTFIPPELYELSSLRSLEVYGNDLRGTLPTGFGLMTNLELLDLSSNAMSGTIISELGSMSRLQVVHLYDNRFTGILPHHLPPTLADMDVEANGLTGTLPTELGRLTNLGSLWMGLNSLSGPIPSEVGRLTALDSLVLDDCGISGTIPSEIALLPDLVQLALEHNPMLTGTIPANLGSMVGNESSSLARIKLQNTSLTGTIPDHLCILGEDGCERTSPLFGMFECHLGFTCGEILCGCHCNCDPAI